MRLLLSAIVALALGSVAQAEDILAGIAPAVGSTYELSASAPVSVGSSDNGELFGITVTATNVSGDDGLNINGILDATFGSNGSLHHEQAPSPVPVFNFVTPLASSFTDSTAPVSAVDSHFLQDALIALPDGDPAETTASTPSGVPASALEPLFGAAATTGFGGVLTGSYGFDSTTESIDLAYLVFEVVGGDLGSVEIDYSVGINNGAGLPETFTGSIFLIPEPSTMLLGSLAAIGFAARRRV